MVKKVFFLLLQVAMLTVMQSCSGPTSINVGKWNIAYDEQANAVDVCKDGVLIGDNLYAAFNNGERIVTSYEYTHRSFSQSAVSDVFGKGMIYTVEYTADALPKLTQSFYIYPERDYILTDFTLQSDTEVASNYMAAVNIDSMPALVGEGDDLRMLFIPFDNDCWIRYASHPAHFESLTSYEATAMFNNASRNGWVVGSVEHDNWKTAVTVACDTVNKSFASMCCYGGVADSLTRDSKPHGALKGQVIKSPKVMLGYFADWRDGLDTYGEANALVAPPKAWNKAVPFGWNSWGALQFDLTYEKAIEVSDFYRDHLQCNNFHNADTLVYTGLDSGWNSFTEEQLRAFVERCKANGQVAGIYWTPFVHWGRNPNQYIEHGDGYQFKDVYLYANGKHQTLDGGRAIDPTHPAIEATMKYFSDLFTRLGYEYVKLDFMTHGAMEADSWYLPEIQTGIQAYNYGLQLIEKYFGHMYINFSISPAFPAQYAQSRRIACDAWNKIKDTEYTLNALSYGWWLDKPYQYNDPDHIVLRDATEGENRARVTSGVITGIFICGDDFSAGGAEIDKERARKFLTNAEVISIANGVSFRPVEGCGERSENQFIRIEDENTAYYAIFNYTDQPLNATIDMQRIGLDATAAYRMRELWSGVDSEAAATFQVTVPAADVALFRIEKK